MRGIEGLLLAKHPHADHVFLERRARPAAVSRTMKIRETFQAVAQLESSRCADALELFLGRRLWRVRRGRRLTTWSAVGRFGAREAGMSVPSLRPPRAFTVTALPESDTLSTLCRLDQRSATGRRRNMTSVRRTTALGAFLCSGWPRHRPRRPPIGYNVGYDAGGSKYSPLTANHPGQRREFDDRLDLATSAIVGFT